MGYLAGIVALLTSAAGWYYLFYSRAAQHLEGVEEQAMNARRVRMRRVGGVAMLLLGAFLYAGSYPFGDPAETPAAFVAAWMTVFALLIAIVILAWIDVRLTRRMRERRLKRQRLDPH
jgi:UDP-N-acetylmuramyl pentapeptide phosphotransferase/UDP-N-acetylglucosamine-1-phosphate transferase